MGCYRRTPVVDALELEEQLGQWHLSFVIEYFEFGAMTSFLLRVGYYDM
jgi:hypothetical protein